MSGTFSIVELQYNGSDRTYREKQNAIRFDWTAKAKTMPPNWQFAIETRSSRTDMPGSDEPIEQILGTHYSQSPFTGKWDDRWAGAGYAESARKNMEQLVKNCSPVRVEYNGVGGFNFIGVIKRANITVRKTWLYEYSLDFSPHFRDGEQRKAADSSKVAPTQDYQTRVEQIAAQMSAMHQSAPVRYMIVNVFGLVDAVMKTIEKRVNSMSAVISSRVLVANVDSLVNSVSKIASDLDDLRSNAMELRTQLASASAATDLYFDDTLIAAQYDAWSRGLMTLGRDLAVMVYEAAQELRRRVDDKAQALYRPQAGESLYGIANRFLGSPSAWRVIADRNNLYSMELDGTELLVIPGRS